MLDHFYGKAQEKALKINLDRSIYGSFAEIGAGQEVARFFFHAGGASGTVAKTISAYDMVFSDTIYGKEESKRYVCESRLLKMLDKEYRLVVERLKEHRPAETKFFAFANTVSALNYQKTNEGHGWVGLRFQSAPKSKPSEVVLHVRLKDRENILQQEVIGVVGVNLMYAAFFMRQNQEEFIHSLVEDLSSEHLEIDMIRVSGPAFQGFDNRVLGLGLLKIKMTHAVLFGADGQMLQPAEVFYKKDLLVLRGSFRPLNLMHLDMFRCALESERNFKKVSDDFQMLAVISMLDLRAEGEVDESDFLARVDLLNAARYPVMISNFHEYYQLASYLGHITRRQINIVLGLYNLQEIFDFPRFKDLSGEHLEALGILAKHCEHLFIYPENKKGVLGDTVSLRGQFDQDVEPLFAYLLHLQKIIDLQHFDKKIAGIHSREVIKLIRHGNKKFASMVPKAVAEMVVERKLFGYCSESEEG